MIKIIPIIGLLLFPLMGIADTPPPNTVKAKLYSGDGLDSISATGDSINVHVTNSGGLSTVNQGDAGTESWLTEVTSSALPTNACMETGGNLASMNAKIPALGQALAAGSVPVVLTSAQLSALVPLTTVNVTGTFWQSVQPVSGTVTANAGTGTFTVDASGHTVPVSGTFFQATQPVSLLSLPSLAVGSNTIGNVNINGTVPVSGTITTTNAANGTPGSAVPSSATQVAGSDGTNLRVLKASAAGVLSVDASGTTVPVSGTFFQTTQPVSAASLPLPTGAATESTLSSLNGKVTAVNTGAVVVSSSALPTGASTAAKQPALGTAGTASSDVLTVQGITSMTPLKVDASGTTVTISGSVTANAGTNLNTSALALETGGNLASINTKTPALGQALAAASVPVVLTAAQITTLTPPTSVTVSGTVTANAGTNLNTSALALETGGNLASINTKTPALGQALAAASVPVVMTASQLTTLTPLSTVTANIGTTGGLALDTSVTGLQVAQGSTTSGQKGIFNLGAVTTAAPSYTTAQSSPLSLTLAGALRVDGSAVTQPASLSTLPALVAGSAIIGKVGIDQTTPGTTNLVALAANQSVNQTQVNGVAVSTGNGVAGTGVQRVTIASDNTAFAVNSAPVGGSSGSQTSGTVSTVITLTAPANAQGFILQNIQSSTANLRYAIGATATTTVGIELAPGQDSNFIPGGANISLVSESGTQGYGIQWIVK